jgi:hypothetical protein
MYVMFNAKGLKMLSIADFIKPITAEWMNMEHYWNTANREKYKDSEQTCSSIDLSITNPTLIGLGVNLGPHAEWPLINQTHEPRNSH